MIRPAKPKDVPVIVDIAVESVTKNWGHHPLKLDPDAMKDMVEICLGPAHFLYVAEIDGEVVAAVCGHVNKSYWYKGLELAVLLHYSRSDGQWARLMVELSRWVKSRSGIKMASVVLEEQIATDKMLKFLKRLGFGIQAPAATYVRAV